ncbi:hypothetical protein V8E36_008228 [Tilletia maclaganii]
MMDALRIVGGAKLSGDVVVGGSKNACLPAMAAALLAKGTSTLYGAPDLADIEAMRNLLQHLGLLTSLDDCCIRIDGTRITTTFAPCDLVRTMRASILVLGPLLLREGSARIALPGGCAIGARPIDQHVAGLRALGASVKVADGHIDAEVPHDGLCGAVIRLQVPSVTGTETLMLAAAGVEGITEIHGAAKEPEVADLACVLRQMGVSVDGEGSDMIRLVGKTRLRPYQHHVTRDRIEAGTLLAAGALCGDRLRILDAPIAHLHRVIAVLKDIGARMDVDESGRAITISARKRLHPAHVTTAPYPGFPTDMQAQIMTVLSLACGYSTVTESVFENRFMHVPELNRLGAQIRTENRLSTIQGVTHFSGTDVTATDLRASAALVLAGLAAKGETIVRHIFHLDRGYDAFEVKLASVGARIERFKESWRSM